jgi:hypothetical protein
MCFFGSASRNPPSPAVRRRRAPPAVRSSRRPGGLCLLDPCTPTGTTRAPSYPALHSLGAPMRATSPLAGMHHTAPPPTPCLRPGPRITGGRPRLPRPAGPPRPARQQGAPAQCPAAPRACARRGRAPRRARPPQAPGPTPSSPQMPPPGPGFLSLCNPHRPAQRRAPRPSPRPRPRPPSGAGRIAPAVAARPARGQPGAARDGRRDFPLRMASAAPAADP